MKFITLNCGLLPWSATRRTRRQLIVDSIIKENPDVIFMQEIYFSSDRNFLIKAFSEKGYIDIFSCKNLILISRFPLKNQSCVSLSNQGAILSWAVMDGIYKKSFQVADIIVAGEEITLVNVHLLSTYGFDNKSYQQIRKAQLLQIKDHLKKTGKEKIVFGGDFNFSLNSTVYNYTILDLGYIDPLANVIGNTTEKANTTKLLFGNIRDERIDHFFIKGFTEKKTTGEIICTKASMIKGKPLHPSDHYGVLLSIV